MSRLQAAPRGAARGTTGRISLTSRRRLLTLAKKQTTSPTLSKLGTSRAKGHFVIDLLFRYCFLVFARSLRAGSSRTIRGGGGDFNDNSGSWS